MALRNIVKEGDDILRKKARAVTVVDDRIRTLLDDMLETMRCYDGCGIAASQVGMLKRIFIVEVEDQVYELINPEFVETDGVQHEEEGCLSVPGVIGTVERPYHIKIKGLDRYGKEVVYEADDFLAKAFCHEYDHLEGVLFTDKAVDLRDAE